MQRKIIKIFELITYVNGSIRFFKHDIYLFTHLFEVKDLIFLV